MKKVIALLLIFAFVFAFAACKNGAVNEPSSAQSTEETTTLKPGEWVTNAAGEVQTTMRYYPILGDDGLPMTQIVTDQSGKEQIVAVTTGLADIATNPGYTKPHTVPPGNTMANTNKAWPNYEFFSALPKAAETVADYRYQQSDKGEVISVYLNGVSYEAYLKYLDECKSAGFAQTSGNEMPEEPEDGQTYIYGSVANGLYVNIQFSTQSAPYRKCDVLISVASYDVTK